MSLLSSALNVAAPGIGEVLSFLLDTLKLLFNPRVWVIAAVVFLLGRVQGCKQEEQHMAAREAAEDRVAAVQVEHTNGVNAKNRAIQQEEENAHTVDVAMLVDLLDDANERLRVESSRGFVPRPGPGAARPLPASCNDVERAFLGAVYASRLVCYDGDELDKGIRGSVERLRGRLAGLAVPAADALDDLPRWGRWSAQTGACPAR